MEKTKMIAVEVAYARVNQQKIIALEVAEGSSVAEVILQSCVLTLFPEIDLTKQKVGVFSKARKLSDVVKHGERIEIYRELTIDPKDARRAKAVKGKR
jgi:putative ubiquitin-RnfH superfamily antitoxin RatB of RatAB toxin-antitoxin module